MTLYDLNKNAYAALPNMTEAEKRDAVRLICNFVDSGDEDYFMLLNNELHYYTVFRWAERSAHDVAVSVMEIVKELSPNLKAVERNDDGSAIEFWLTDNENQCYMFVLFGYTQGVIEI